MRSGRQFLALLVYRRNIGLFRKRRVCWCRLRDRGHYGFGDPSGYVASAIVLPRIHEDPTVLPKLIALLRAPKPVAEVNATVVDRITYLASQRSIAV